MKTLCVTCKNKMTVPGSALIECCWRRGHKKHVWFFEGFSPNYPKQITECEGYNAGKEDDWTKEESA